MNLTDDGRTVGTTTATLSISNLVAADAGEYVVVINNQVGSVTSDPATLTVNPVGPAETIWSDGLAASVSAAAKPGSTYVIGSEAAAGEKAIGCSPPGLDRLPSPSDVKASHSTKEVI